MSKAVIGAVGAVATGAFALAASPALAQSPPVTFSSTGAEQAYVVPADVSHVTIEAQGAGGGTACAGTVPGRGANLSASFSVSPGSVLWVEVGEAGASGELPGPFCRAVPAPAAFNGGGVGGVVAGGGGGGASDVRTVPRGEPGSLGSRLIVAGGGGGGGSGGSIPGGAGGDAASAGAGPGGGGPGTLTGPGAAGTSGGACSAGPTGGAFGAGGDGAAVFPNNGGGGGGGGYFGGGGGHCNGGGTAAGGGGGSSYLAPQAVNPSAITVSSLPPTVVITPVEPPDLIGPPGPSGPTGPAGPPGPAGATTNQLVLALATSGVRAKPGATVRLRYAATVAASVRLRILDGQNEVGSFRGSARVGANQLKLRAPSQRGRYRLELVASAGSQQATARGRLAVRAPQRQPRDGRKTPNN